MINEKMKIVYPVLVVGAGVAGSVEEHSVEESSTPQHSSTSNRNSIIYGNMEGTKSSKMCVPCLCMYVCCV